MSEKNIEPKTPIELAADAIKYTLERIKRDPNLRYHAGAFTETFGRLKTAHAALTGKTPDQIEDEILGSPILGLSAAQKLDEIRELVQDDCDGAPDANSIAKQSNAIMEIIRRNH